jgi:hypothetical protein
MHKSAPPTGDLTRAAAIIDPEKSGPIARFGFRSMDLRGHVDAKRKIRNDLGLSGGS